MLAAGSAHSEPVWQAVQQESAYLNNFWVLFGAVECIKKL